jgi:hypothetical protein
LAITASCMVCILARVMKVVLGKVIKSRAWQIMCARSNGS